MKLRIREDRFGRLPAELVFKLFFEMVEHDDNLKDSHDYFPIANEFNRKDLEDAYPLSEIKDDIYGFIEDWKDDVLKIKGVTKMDKHWKSKRFGLSNYIQLTFDQPKDMRLFGYYLRNKNKYNGIKFRFSDHTSQNDDSDIQDGVDFVGKTFDQSADEMEIKIQEYIDYLRFEEQKELDKIIKQKRTE